IEAQDQQASDNEAYDDGSEGSRQQAAATHVAGEHLAGGARGPQGARRGLKLVRSRHVRPSLPVGALPLTTTHAKLSPTVFTNPSRVLFSVS
ncbi:hypothetical protein JYU34_022906, partial [Plutella xylostella]